MSDKDPTNISEELARDALERADKTEREKLEAEDWRWLMSSARGRRIMAALRLECGANRSSFTGNSHTFYLEGRRSIALHLDEQMYRHAPEAFIDLLKETYQ